jgi:calcineurin-like phosphoesterase family protein
MTTWFTSDHHFGHANVIKYDNRPFSNVDEMNRELVSRWNKKIQPGDLVYYLGDFSMSPFFVKTILPLLNGEKVLVAGNHDRCFKMATKWMDFYKEYGFKEIHHELNITLSEKDVLLCHFPYRTGQTLNYQTVRPKDEGKWLIHGHNHLTWKQKDKQINVGVCQWDYYPVSQAEIEALITEG